MSFTGVYIQPDADLWNIPKHIREYNEDYTLYLRQYSPYPLWLCETGIYVV